MRHMAYLLRGAGVSHSKWLLDLARAGSLLFNLLSLNLRSPVIRIGHHHLLQAGVVLLGGLGGVNRR